MRLALSARQDRRTKRKPGAMRSAPANSAVLAGASTQILAKFRVATRAESPASFDAVTGRLLSLGNVGASQRVSFGGAMLRSSSRS